VCQELGLAACKWLLKLHSGLENQVWCFQPYTAGTRALAEAIGEEESENTSVLVALADGLETPELAHKMQE
jgi:hypothetical protein